MSTDRELLELAARAAGVKIRTWSNCQAGGFMAAEQVPEHRTNFWNPLTDDSDAFRLAVKLHLSVAFWKEDVSALVGLINMEFPEAYGACPYAATRRAIVRAAAEIGREKGGASA